MTTVEADRPYKLMSWYTVALGAVAIVGSILGMIIVDDASTYYSVVNNNQFCCGHVSEHWYERPVTYALIDHWTPPAWHENAAGTERWLVSDGVVKGEVKFWKILQRVKI